MLPGARYEVSIGQRIQSRAWGTLICPMDRVVVMRLSVVTDLIELQRLLPGDGMVGSGYERLAVAMVNGPRR